MVEEQTGDSIVLGGNIVLNGFQQIDGASMIILKKLIGNHVRQISDKAKQFEKIELSIEHDNNIFSVKGTAHDAGTPYAAQHEASNLFISVDQVLKKINSAME